VKRLTVAPQFRSHYAWHGTGSYHALQVTIRLRMTHGRQWDFNYTYSNSIDLGSNTERVNEVDAYYQADPIISSWSPAQLRGVSDFDTTHQCNTNWICQLPFEQGHRFAGTSGRLLNAVVRGWQWSGPARWTRGFPTTIGTFTGFPTNWYLPSTAILSGPKPQTGTFLNDNGNPGLFKDPVAVQGDFRYSLPGESGRRNELRGPVYFGNDSGLSRSWSVTDHRA